ncbi:MAG: transcriptional repressor LexA [Planctomycetes bacterium]|nr:transcriptional repressor LexA [Planctomycetota bacterium]
MARPFSTDLTARQRRILDWVRAFADRNGMPPTVREIGSAFKITPRSVFDYLKVLERKGCLKRGRLGARSLTFSSQPLRTCPNCVSVPVVGRIAAGQPLEAIEDASAAVTAGQELSKGGAVFALQVTGDSMVEAGILDGDIVLVRKQETADDGDIVVALLEDEATLKYLYREGKQIRLQPANSRLHPIYVDADKLRIQGKVVSVQRLLD